MENVLVALLVAALGAIAFLAGRGRLSVRPSSDVDRDYFASLREEVRVLSRALSSTTTVVTQRLEGIDSRMMQTQVDGNRMVQDIFSTLGKVEEATAAVAEQAREFSSLQDLLRPPKARGGIGEAMLEELLRQVLPPQAFVLQHRFTTGTIVDAVVRAGGKLVCIDSKFPLSNYRRMCDSPDDIERSAAQKAFASDVYGHIRDISTRYIIPDEETFDFAVMYVPAEGVYGEVLNLSHRGASLFETAIDRRVVPMSPLTLYGYLQTVLFGLKCLRIESTAKEVLEYCGRLQGDIDRFAGEYEVLGRHIGNARAKYEEGYRRLERFRDKLDRVVEFEDENPAPPLEAIEAVGDLEAVGE
ncbi:MAG TPA: DNA recombination protein RmuC [Actinomycetota bacterium]|jgi:DNA recombination protein RmuC|nr:DNA recombination protein RmuC [Actinomycetota bacterium]